MNIFKRKCDNCKKKLGFFEHTYTWFNMADEKLKYCEECNAKGLSRNSPPLPTRYKKPFNGICELCGNDILNELDAFYCKYCKKWHCTEHRLPEKHNCPKPSKPKGFTSSPISYKKK